MSDALRVHGDRHAEPGLLDLAVNIWPGARPGWLHEVLVAALDEERYPDERPAVAAIAARRRGAGDDDLFERLAADDRIPLDRAALAALVADPVAFVGDAPRQTAAFVARAHDVVARFPEAAGYHPGPLL
ncbi:MAG: hypothetical protein KY450_03350 [Actinobacteria bacterium]|nr:hypothetical protein [Actinomycetota bacterium]